MKGVGVAVLVPAGHAGVGVPEPFHAGNAKDGSGGHGLPAPPVRERLAIRQIIGHLPVLAMGGEDDHDAMAERRRARHRPGGRRRLVIGVRVEKDDGGHRAIHLAPARK